MQINSAELEHYQTLLETYEPAKTALTALKEENGDLQATFDLLWQEKNGVSPTMGEKSFWEVTKKVLRQEICSEDDSFREKVKEYRNNPSSTPLLTGLIVYLVGLAGLPVDPAIATIIVLYILKIGIDIFCQYTEAERE